MLCKLVYKAAGTPCALFMASFCFNVPMWEVVSLLFLQSKDNDAERFLGKVKERMDRCATTTQNSCKLLVTCMPLLCGLLLWPQ